MSPITLDYLPGAFSDRTARRQQEDEELKDDLYRQIGQLKVELEWLKKKLGSGVEEEAAMDRTLKLRDHDRASVRAGWFVSIEHVLRTSQQNLQLMRSIDAQYTRRPFFGSPRITDWLRKQGQEVNHKRVERLMRIMALRRSAPAEQARAWSSNLSMPSSRCESGG